MENELTSCNLFIINQFPLDYSYFAEEEEEEEDGDFYMYLSIQVFYSVSFA